MSCADSPTICYPQLNVEFGSKISEIYMNSERVNVVAEVTASEEQVGTFFNLNLGYLFSHKGVKINSECMGLKLFSLLGPIFCLS